MGKKVLELDTGMAIEYFSEKEINKLIKKGKSFKISVPTVLTREVLDTTIKVKKSHLKLKIFFTGFASEDGDQNSIYYCEKDAAKLHDKLFSLLLEVYT